MKKLVFILFLILGTIALKSQTQSIKNNQFFDINVTLMKFTFRLYGPGSCGTAFIVAKENLSKPGTYYFVLITAAHVLDSIKGNDAIINLRTKISSGDTIIELPLLIRNKKNNFYKKHPKVDVAAMYIALPEVFTDSTSGLSTSYFATEYEFIKWGINPGTELNCLGYPKCVNYNKGDYAILRSGKIASYPLIPFDENPTFLFDFEVFPGNSGGPVYFQKLGLLKEDGTYSPGHYDQFIVGLVTEQILAVNLRNDSTDLKIGSVINSNYILETIEMLK